jgi:hypothetical protein
MSLKLSNKTMYTLHGYKLVVFEVRAFRLQVQYTYILRRQYARVNKNGNLIPCKVYQTDKRSCASEKGPLACKCRGID